MNKNLIKKLTEKWSQPEGMPGKGYELVREENGLSPCAQSEAIMLSKGMGVMDFQALWRGLTTSGNLFDRVNLDKITAKTLGISVIHSILLRRFNDLSSQSPAIVLNEPERVLGKNWDKVLEFWHFIDSLTEGQWKELIIYDVSKEYESRKRDLKLRTETLDVIIPDLYYTMGSSTPLDPALIERQTEEEVAKVNPSFKVTYSNNQHAPKILPNYDRLRKYPNDSPCSTEKAIVVGDYSRAYFGWIAASDYVRTNLPSGPGWLNLSSLQVLLACATNEIQTLEKGRSYEDLYFCKIIGYNPVRGNTLRKVQRKVREYTQSSLDNLTRFYRITDNFIFSRFSKDPEVKREATKEMVEGVLNLTVEEIVNDLAWKKIQETYEVGKGRFFGTLRIRVPKLGPGTEADKKFSELVQVLKQDYSVWPLSFCNVEDSPSKEGAEWAVSSKKEKSKPRFNAPTGYKS
jgi:hypothetical protein